MSFELTNMEVTLSLLLPLDVMLVHQSFPQVFYQASLAVICGLFILLDGERHSVSKETCPRMEHLTLSVLKHVSFNAEFSTLTVRPLPPTNS